MAEWSIPFDVLAERTGKRIEDVIRASTIEVFRRVILRSPVDTGRFRANWFASYGSPRIAVSNATDKGGDSTVHYVSGAVLSYPVGGIVYLTNSLPYAEVIEYGLYPNPPKRGSQKVGETEPTIHVTGGYSMQAPHGVVRVTAIEFDAAVRKQLGGNQ